MFAAYRNTGLALCLVTLRGNRITRPLWTAILLAFAAKAGMDIFSGQAQFEPGGPGGG